MPISCSYTYSIKTCVKHVQFFELHAIHDVLLLCTHLLFDCILYVLVLMILTCLYDISYFCEKDFHMSFVLSFIFLSS